MRTARISSVRSTTDLVRPGPSTADDQFGAAPPSWMPKGSANRHSVVSASQSGTYDPVVAQTYSDSVPQVCPGA